MRASSRAGAFSHWLRRIGSVELSGGLRHETEVQEVKERREQRCWKAAWNVFPNQTAGGEGGHGAARPDRVTNSIVQFLPA